MPHYNEQHKDDLIALQKALSYGDQGAALLDTIVEPTVSRLMDFQNPLRQNLMRERQVGGDAKRLLRRQNAPTAAEFVAETGSFTAYGGTYDQMVFPFKILGTKVTIYDFLKDTSANILDIVLEETGARMEELRDFEDYYFVRGVCSATQFEGLSTLITDNQAVATTTASGGDALTLSELDEAIDTCLENPANMMMIMARRTRRALNGLLQPYQQFVNISPMEVEGGFRVPIYQGIPIFTSTNMSITQTFNGSTNTAETGSVCSSIFIIGRHDVKVCELARQGGKFLQWAKMATTTLLQDDYEILGKEVLFLRNPLKVSKLIGINA